MATNTIVGTVVSAVEQAVLDAAVTAASPNDPKITIALSIKFRVAFITLLTLSENWSIPLPIPTAFVSKNTSLVSYNNRGVVLSINLVP